METRKTTKHQILPLKDPYKLRFIRKYGDKIDSCDEENKTLLINIIECGCSTSKEFHDLFYALNHGWDINRQDVYGNTALDHAIDMGNLDILYILLKYNPSYFSLQKATKTILQNYSRDNIEYCKAMIHLIHILDGISKQQNPDLMKYAIEGSAYPMIIPLLKAGYSLPENMENHVPMYLYGHHEFERFFQFYANVNKWADEFDFAENSPLYVKDGILKSRPQYAQLLVPHFSRKYKIRIKRNNYTLSYMHAMATNSLVRINQ